MMSFVKKIEIHSYVRTTNLNTCAEKKYGFIYTEMLGSRLFPSTYSNPYLDLNEFMFRRLYYTHYILSPIVYHTNIEAL